MAAAIPEGTRKSDRWITPGVLIAALIVTAVLVAVLAGYCAWLMSRGIDPAPLVDLVTKIGTATAALGTLLLQLFGRTTQAKVERNTGVLAGYVSDLADQVAAQPVPAATPPGAVTPAPVTSTAVAGLPPVPTSSDYYARLREGAPQ